MKDAIILTGIEILARHGCSEAERKHEQLFIVDAKLYLDLSWAGRSDDLGDTIDYAVVISEIRTSVTSTSRNLIETVAQEIAEMLLRRYLLLDAVKITIHKPVPPVKEKFAGAAVEILRKRGENDLLHRAWNKSRRPQKNSPQNT